jgi:hypothetical protein
MNKMKVTVYTKHIIKEVVEIPDEFAVMLDDDWIDDHFHEFLKMHTKLEHTLWPLVSKDTEAIIAVYDEDDKNCLMEE